MTLSIFNNITHISNGAYFSPGDECIQAILHCIRSAQKSLDVCVFTISDDRITSALLLAYHKGIEVRILTDNEKLHDKGSDIQELANAGIHTRVDNTANHMHHKFAIIDNEHVLTGSYNWTRSAALYNHENILVTDEKTVVKAYLKQFEQLWEKMTPFH